MSTWVRNKIDTEGLSTTDSVVKTTTNVLLASVIIAPANPKRKGFYIWNNSANSVYITFGTVSTSATPSFILATFNQHIMVSGLIWTGPLSAIRNSGTGACTVWEFE